MIFHSSHYMVKQRITMTIDSYLLKDLRMKQANLIEKTKRGVTLSQVINEILQKGI